MSYKPRSLHGILQDLGTEIFLPHIQRPFVWDKDQMSKLFDSLMRNYPIQTMLFWKTKEGIKARKFMEIIDTDVDLHTLYDEHKSENGVKKTFVLDGQQRIQTLYALYVGGVKNNGITEEAYIKIDASEISPENGQIFTIEFKQQGSSINLPWFRIRDLMTKYNRLNSEAIAVEINKSLNVLNPTDQNNTSREMFVRMNLAQLISILREDRHFWVEELDGIANQYDYNTILEIFVRVNSGGTKLVASDLMFAAMKELSSSIEENLEIVADTLSVGNLSFEIDTILKGILLVNEKRATVDPKKFSGIDGKTFVERLDAKWEAQYERAFNALRDFIVKDLKVDNARIVRSYNAFVPIFEYFFHNPVPDHMNRTRLISFFYKAQLFNWFSSQTDGILDYLHNNFLRDIFNKDFPLNAILDYFSSRGKRTNFDQGTLTDHSLRFFHLHLLYVEKHNISAFNVKLKNNSPHIDHIYPKSKLVKTPFDLNTNEINHIGNYRFVGATDNIKKRAENPGTYFQRLKDANIDISKHLIVDSFARDPSLLKMDRQTYMIFRDERTKEIFNIISPILNCN